MQVRNSTCALQGLPLDRLGGAGAVRLGAMEGAKLYTVAYPPYEEVTGRWKKAFHDVQLGGGVECGGYVL